MDEHGRFDVYADFLRMFDRMDVLPFFSYMREESTAIDPALWYEAYPEHSAAGLFIGLLRLTSDSYDAQGFLIGDKSPSYINQLGLLSESFPRALFIHIVRDASDYCLSINRAWGKNMIQAASIWAESVGSFLQVKENFKSVPDSFLIFSLQSFPSVDNK